MAYLGNAARTKEVLSKYNMSAKKKFGQNFLIDSGVLDGIVEASGVSKEDCVLEIGPGNVLQGLVKRIAGTREDIIIEGIQ